MILFMAVVGVAALLLAGTVQILEEREAARKRRERDGTP